MVVRFDPNDATFIPKLSQYSAEEYLALWVKARVIINNLNYERDRELKRFLTNQYENGNKTIYPINMGDALHRATTFLPIQARDEKAWHS